MRIQNQQPGIHLLVWQVAAMADSAGQWFFQKFILGCAANLENSAVATGLEKVSFHSSPKERQCQRMLKLPHNCTHLTR